VYEIEYLQKLKRW